MIPPLPSNIGFSFIATPIWQWVTLALPEAAAPAPAAASGAASGGGEAGTCEPPAAPPEPAPPFQRLVLKGYAWLPQAQWYPLVNPGWDHFVDNDPAEIHDRGVRQEEERQQQEAALRQKLAARPADRQD